MNIKIIVIGVGRMGVRHLVGLNGINGLDVVAVDPSENAISEAKKNTYEFTIKWHSNLSSIQELKFDLAIISSTANARLENLKWCIERGAKNIILEKPLAQSRAELDKIESLVNMSSVNVYCNFYRRQLKYCLDIRKRFQSNEGSKKHLTIVIASGAMGLACNGLHYIDSAIHMTGSKNPKIISAWLDKTPILSGRGAGFSDYGGGAVVQLNERSKLIMNVMADSSAPTTLLFYENHLLTMVDQDGDMAIEYLRDKKSKKPNYLYGQEYKREIIKGVERVSLSKLTNEWVLAVISGKKPEMPLIHSSVQSHHLLFDILEETGLVNFQFT